MSEANTRADGISAEQHPFNAQIKHPRNGTLPTLEEDFPLSVSPSYKQSVQFEHENSASRGSANLNKTRSCNSSFSFSDNGSEGIKLILNSQSEVKSQSALKGKRQGAIPHSEQWPEC